MGKGGGCVPSKKKVPHVAGDSPSSATAGTSRTAPIQRDDTSADDTTEIAQASSSEVVAAATGMARLRIFIVFYSMYGHVEGLARRLKKGVDGVEGVEGVLYRVPETLSTEILQQMRAPPKDDGIPVITAEELAAASMAAQMKAFFDSTGQLWKEQKLAGKPAGFFVSTGTQGGGQETTA
ncbi:hypothetical protein Ahy_Scaffold1g106808 isoform E [Arachis hypogaea]|uniref:Flavodoxin-like domain-containing protein n=1 Tax=Arachis hypogaea TaxID=3818 RepID=A0A444WS92_ARAHY|nr:hypothetical protein Ahy_Scaffold1g106808 isoform E [Arachis hypogaea]